MALRYVKNRSEILNRCNFEPANVARKQLYAGSSHDLNKPLQRLAGNQRDSRERPETLGEIWPRWEHS